MRAIVAAAIAKPLPKGMKVAVVNCMGDVMEELDVPLAHVTARFENLAGMGA
jgi:hypothetical protein